MHDVQLFPEPPAQSQPGPSRPPQLVLSLFPGLDLLGRAFSAAGYSVVKGPDLMWSERIEDFHVPAGRFDGIIGGPPCVHYSDANRTRKPELGDALVRHFLRIIDESQPTWWLMENVRNVPDVAAAGYTVQRLDCIDSDFGGRQRRLRHIQYGDSRGWIIRPLRTSSPRPVTFSRAVLSDAANVHDRHCRRLDAQGFPSISLSPFKRTTALALVGNGVPRSTGYALALAQSLAGPVTPADCTCGCGRRVTPPAIHANAACRQRMHRLRTQPRRRVTLDPHADARRSSAALADDAPKLF